VAIDPTTPVTPITPAAPAGSPPSSAAALQAIARAAMVGTTARLGEIVGRPTTAPPNAHATVEQAAQASTQDAGRAAEAPVAKGGANTSSARAGPAVDARWVQVVRATAAEAVPRQAGLAPLMADARAIVDHAEAPPEVQNAARTLLARTPRASEISTAQGLRKAVERSGVFLEARLARSVAPASDAPPGTVAPEADMKAALLVFRAALSNWLARSPADPIEAPEANVAGVKAEAKAELASPAGAAPPAVEPQKGDRTPGPVSAETPATPSESEPPQTVAPRTDAPKTGATSQADEAEPLPAPGHAEPPPSDETIEPRFASFLASPKPARPSPVKPEAAALGLIGLIEAETPAGDNRPAAPSSPASPLATRGYGALVPEATGPKTPPPPFAGGPMAGQRPMASDLSPEAHPQEIVRRLLKGAGAALARQDLLQIASLPEARHDVETGEPRPQVARWNLDVPFMTPQGVAVAQFEISHDGGGTGGGVAGPAERTYRVRFSIDVEPLGPVHALVTLTGARTRVSLWAERAETIARLRAGEESLGAALRQAELSPEVAVHSGAPPLRDAGVLGHFVDQAS